MLKKMTPQEAHRRFQEGTVRFIDIRSTEEFAQMSIEGSLLAPLPVVRLQNLAMQKGEHTDIVFVCRSGSRVENATSILEGLFADAYTLDGGLVAWQKAKLPLRKGNAPAIPLERQIFIAAGCMILLGVLGSLVWPPLFWLAGFVGAGLVFAGASGFCGLGMVLSKMPWNKQPRV